MYLYSVYKFSPIMKAADDVNTLFDLWLFLRDSFFHFLSPVKGKTQRPTQRLSFQPPIAEPIRYLHHSVRLAPPTRETYSGLVRV